MGLELRVVVWGFSNCLRLWCFDVWVGAFYVFCVSDVLVVVGL